MMNVQVESFPNSVTGQERETRVLLLEGFICNLAGTARIKIMYNATSNLNFERIRQSCLLFISIIQGFVTCWLNFGLMKKKKESQVDLTGLLFSISIV